MAAIFQLRRGSGSVSLVDGELYVNKGIDSLQYAVGDREITLAKLNEPNTGSLDLYGDLTASNLYVTGNVKIDGKITVGNETGDTLNIVASLSSSLIPSDHKSFDIGGNDKWYKSLYVETISSSFISGAIAGVGNLQSFSASVDSRLDYLEGPFSTSVDSRMDLLENAMSGSNRLYVSPEGDDSNDGSQHNPFKTIKAAVESLGSAVYTNMKRYTIFVGSGNYTEQNPIAVPPGVAIVGDTLRTVRLTAANPTKDFFHTHDSNYFYGLRFLDLQHPAYAFSFPSSTATSTISAGGVSSISVVHSLSGYTDGTNQDLGIIIEGPDNSGSIATATANVVEGVITQINVVNTGDNYVSGEKPHISIPAPVGQRPVITTSPYVQNCSSITGPFNTSGVKVLQALPYDEVAFNIDEQGAGGGIRIDGNLVHPLSPLESFVADAFTQVNQGGPGHLVINKGYAQFVSCFTTFCTYGFKTANGGFANISNSVIDFGKYGLISKTYFPQTYNTGSSLETKTSTVSGFVIDENGAGYVGSTTGVTITGGGASVQATAEATINANGSIDEIVLLTPGSGYTTQPSVTIDAPTGPGGIQATTVAGKALISGVSEMLMVLETGTRGVDISSNMILNGVDYLVTDVQEVSGQPNRRRITTYPAPPSITTNDQIKFHQLSNISTGGLVMEYVGSGVTYNALPKFGGVPIRTREIIEFAPGRVFYSTVDNIGNLKIGDFFAVNQLTGEVTIDANSFNLSGLNAIGPFRRNGVAVGVVLQEVSNNTTLLNSQGLYGEDTVPTQYAVKEYVQTINTSLDSRLDKLEVVSASLNQFTQSANERFTEIGIVSGSLIASASAAKITNDAQDVSLTQIHLYTSSLKDAIIVSGSGAASTTTIRGNFQVLGQSSIITSQIIHLDDNIIELNGTAALFGGFLVKDPTGGSKVSGSLKWNTELDRWEAGKDEGDFTSISKILLAGGDGVLSSSLQLTDLNQFTSSTNTRLGLLETSTASLNLFSASVTSSLEKIYQTTASLNLFSASVTSSLEKIYQTTASLNQHSASLNAFSGNVNVRFDNLQTYTTSVDGRFTTLATYTGSLNTRLTEIGIVSGALILTASNHEQRIGQLESKSSSVDVSITNINTFTESVNNRFTALATYTGSVNSDLTSIHQTTASLNLFTASAYVSLSLMTASIVDHEDRITYVEGLNGITGGNPLIPLNQFSASAKISIANLESFTSSIDTTIKNKLNIEGVVSGSSQVLITDLDGYADYNDSIMGDIGQKLFTSSFNEYTASQSTGSLVTSISNLNNATSSYETNGRGIVSGSSQIVALLPTGVISGSIQILGGSGVWSSSVQMPAGVVSGSSQILGGSGLFSSSAQIGNYVATITGTEHQVEVAGSGLNNASITLSTPQSIATTSNVQFNSLGIGTAASTTTGEIRATGDITAYYSSDERLKQNIQPIENALQKVNQISGNTYDWKEGYDEVHSHKGNDVGVIAQEIEQILPQIVTNRDNGFKAVQYEKIIPLLIQAIKELSVKIEVLENK
jgi:hypothetical protein